MSDESDYEGIPNTLIVRNVPKDLYSSDEMKQELSDYISQYAKPEKTIYLPSFRRVRMDFSTSKDAYYVRTRLSIFKFHDEILNIFFIQPEGAVDNLNQAPCNSESKSSNSNSKNSSGNLLAPGTSKFKPDGSFKSTKKSTSLVSANSSNLSSCLSNEDARSDERSENNLEPLPENLPEYSEESEDEAQYLVKSPIYPQPEMLHPPKTKRNYLISPPPSPPGGWQQTRETKPKPGIEVEILSKLTELKPGMTHELIARNESFNTPSICVHVCEEDENNNDRNRLGYKPKRRIIQTRRPPC